MIDLFEILLLKEKRRFLKTRNVIGKGV